MSWFENEEIIERIFYTFLSDPNTFSKFMSISSTFCRIGQRIVEKNKQKYGCKCKCKNMRQFKIQDSVKRWHCTTCDYRIDGNCWKKSDYYRNKYIAENVCKRCFNDHWINIMQRRSKLCVSSS